MTIYIVLITYITIGRAHTGVIIHALFMRFCIKKNRFSLIKIMLKIDLLLRYPDSSGTVENESCVDSYQIRELEPEHIGYS